MKFRIATVHAFNHETLKGNPAGICLLDTFPADAEMQKAAAIMGHAETAFMVKRADGSYDLRWFTPTQEVPLCGHATLAAAHLLQSDAICFHTQSGPINVTRDGQHYAMTLPKAVGQTVDAASLQSCLSTPIISAQRSKASYMVEVSNMQALLNCQPQFDHIAKLDSEDLIVTCKGENGYDYAYRCFCPQVGIPEDQVTGSANCILAPYWAEKLGRTQMHALQSSANGGAMNVHVNDTTIQLSGKALTTQQPVSIDTKRSTQPAQVAA